MKVNLNNMKFNKKYEKTIFDKRELFLEKINYECDSSINIFLINGDKKTQVNFEWIYAFSIIDEGDSLKRINEEECGLGIYTFKESSYLSWFNQQSCDIHINENLSHYAIYTQNEIIDIIAACPPVISDL